MSQNRMALVLLAAGLIAPDSLARAGSTDVRRTPELGTQAAPVNAGAKVMADFKTRVDTYAALEKKLEATLPKLPTEATPHQIDQHQRALSVVITMARKSAKQGDLFTPDMQNVVRGLMQQVFKRSDMKAVLRESIEDENPRGSVKVNVNGRYPDNVPLASMPPEVLRNLPPLPEGLEYRFVGSSLILLDVRAHLIVDYVTRALPVA